MKIVVLDGYTLNPGDLSWKTLEQLGDLTVFDRTLPQDVYERAKAADVIFTNKTPLPAEVINQLSCLKYIGVLATGYNVVDTKVAKQKGIIVTNVPGYGTASVVQLTFALLLELCFRVQYHSDSVMKGKWAQSVDWCFWDYPLIELADKTIGIIGFGEIGKRVADIATAFGMKVVANSRKQPDQSHRKNFRWVSVSELLETADVVSIHCPLTEETRGLINKNSLQKMKPSAFLLNTSRGPIIVDEDLADALNKEVIAGAGIDVLSQEPPAADNPLFAAKNCIITPHMAWATKEARSRLMKTAVDNLLLYTEGKPVHTVD